MSYDRQGYNPYSNPYSTGAEQGEPEEPEGFAATSYDDYSRPAPPPPAHGASSGAPPYALQQEQQQLQQPQMPRGEAYEMDDNPNFAFFGEVDDIKRDLVQYEDNIERIEGLHKRSLAESNAEAEAAIQRQLDSLQADTRGLAEHLKQRIKRLEATSQRDATKNAQTQNLKRQFMAMIQKFQATEAAFRQRYRDVAERQYRIVEPDATDAQVEAAIDDENGTQVFSQALMQSNRRGEARAALSEVQARHREIQKIEATLTELAQLFRDMELMVAEQDEQVGNVETNVYTAQQDVERGVDNQFQAIKKARAWRKKKWWCVAILIIIILFCALFFGIYFGTDAHDH